VSVTVSGSAPKSGIVTGFWTGDQDSVYVNNWNYGADVITTPSIGTTVDADSLIYAGGIWDGTLAPGSGWVNIQNYNISASAPATRFVSTMRTPESMDAAGTVTPTWTVSTSPTYGVNFIFGLTAAVSSEYDEVVEADGAAHHWKFGSRDSGSNVWDRISGHNAHYDGSPSQVAGLLTAGNDSDEAYQLDREAGTRQALVVDSGMGIRIINSMVDSDWSLECWYKPSRHDVEQAIIWIETAFLTAGGFAGFRHDETNNDIYTAYPTLRYGPLTDGATYHIVQTFDVSSGESKLYVNGQLRDTDTGVGLSEAPGNQHFIFGSGPGTFWGDYYNDGTIDEVAVYPGVVLDSTQVSNHYGTGGGTVLTQVESAIQELKWDLIAQVNSNSQELVWDLAAQINSATQELIWDLRAAINSGSQELLWDLRAAVNSNSQELLWDVIAQVGSNVQDLLWDLRAAVNSNSQELVWDTRAAANSNPQDLVWDLRGAANSNIQELIWDLRAAANSNSQELIWDLRSEANSAIQELIWDLRSEANSNPQELIWDLIAQVNSPAMTLKWDLIAQVNSNVQELLWDLAASGAVNSAPMSLLWDLRAAADSASQELVWDVRAATASASQSLVWDLRAAVNGAPQSLVWDLRAAVNGAPQSLVWDLRAAVDAAAQELVWDIYAHADSLPQELVWDLVAQVNSAAVVLKWDIAGILSDPLVGPTTLTVDPVSYVLVLNPANTTLTVTDIKRTLSLDEVERRLEVDAVERGLDIDELKRSLGLDP
jgi:hypothetical protein